MKLCNAYMNLPSLTLTLLLVLLSVSVAPAANSADSEPAGKVIARVNEAPIYAADLEWQWRRQLRRRGNSGLVIGRPQITREQLLEKLIRQELLYQQACKAEIKPDAKLVSRQIGQLRSRFRDETAFSRQLQNLGLSEKRLHGLMSKGVVIKKFLNNRFILQQSASDDEGSAWYRDNGESFKRPAQVCASHILIAVRDDADKAERQQAKQKLENLHRRWQAGESFATLARENSDCPSRERDGDLGCFGRRDMVPPFAEAAFALQPGQVSKPIATMEGYHLIQLNQRHEAQLPPYPEIRQQALAAVRLEKAKPLIAAYIEELRANAEVILLP